MQSLAIVGLGNPGADHAGDRHNVGYWFVDRLAARHGASFNRQARLHGEECRIQLGSVPVRLFRPLTWMNRSGQCVRAVMDYYQLAPEQLLIVHDELDLPPGTIRLKRGGGHGGHNGLRDTIAHCGPDFLRLRIGIGHPGHKSMVVGYVLRAPGSGEREQILEALDEAIAAVELLPGEGLQRATQRLHTTTPRPPPESDEFGPAG